MLKNLLYLIPVISFVMTNFHMHAQVPGVSNGTLSRYENFPSRYVASRNVDVWLPQGYNPSMRYAVLYMHDGQMLFDSAATWNGQEWGVDETLGRLIGEKRIAPCIVVAVWNGGELRHSEYFPQEPFEMLPEKSRQALYSAKREGGSSVFNGHAVQSDNYLKFLVDELKPFIDSVYTTHSDQAHTFIAGSSMGGLISLYALCEYPQVFGGAACLSTHWPGIFTTQNNPVPAVLTTYLNKHLPDPSSHKIYFDYGTATLDSMYSDSQAKVDQLMRSKGYTSKNWVTREFYGADHSENAWRKRLDIPLLFLMGK